MFFIARISSFPSLWCAVSLYHSLKVIRLFLILLYLLWYFSLGLTAQTLLIRHVRGKIAMAWFCYWTGMLPGRRNSANLLMMHLVSFNVLRPGPCQEGWRRCDQAPLGKELEEVGKSCGLMEILRRKKWELRREWDIRSLAPMLAKPPPCGANHSLMGLSQLHTFCKTKKTLYCERGSDRPKRKITIWGWQERSEILIVCKSVSFV